MTDYLSYYNSYDPSQGKPIAPENTYQNYLFSQGRDETPGLIGRLVESGDLAAWSNYNDSLYASMQEQYNNWYNSDAQIMARRAEAGINPFFNNGGSNSGGASSVPSRASGANIAAAGSQGLQTATGALTSILGVVSSFIQLKQMFANVGKTEAETSALNRLTPWNVALSGENFNNAWLNNFKSFTETFGRSSDLFGTHDNPSWIVGRYYGFSDNIPLSKLSYDESPYFYNLFEQSKKLTAEEQTADTIRAIQALNKIVVEADSKKAQNIIDNFQKLIASPLEKESEVKMKSFQYELEQLGMGTSELGSVLRFISSIMGFNVSTRFGGK